MKRTILCTISAVLALFATSSLASRLSANEQSDPKPAHEKMVEAVYTEVGLYVFKSDGPLDSDALRSLAGTAPVTDLAKEHGLQQIEAMATSASYIPDERRSAPLSMASIPHDDDTLTAGRHFVNGTIIDASSAAPHQLVSTVNTGVALSAVHTSLEAGVLQFYGARLVIRPDVKIHQSQSSGGNYNYVTAPETVLTGSWSVRSGGRMVMQAAAAGGSGFYIVVIQAGEPTKQRVPDDLIETDGSPIFINDLQF